MPFTPSATRVLDVNCAVWRELCTGHADPAIRGSLSRTITPKRRVPERTGRPVSTGPMARWVPTLVPTVTRTVHAPAPLEVVHAYLRDFGNAEQWDAGTRSCERIDAGPVAVGAQWRNVSVFRGRETTLIYTLEADQPDHVRIVGRNKTVTSEDDMRLSAEEGGTAVEYTATFTFHGAAKLATPLLVPALGSLADDAEQSLYDALQKLGTER